MTRPPVEQVAGFANQVADVEDDRPPAVGDIHDAAGDRDGAGDVDGIGAPAELVELEGPQLMMLALTFGTTSLAPALASQASGGSLANSLFTGQSEPPAHPGCELRVESALSIRTKLAGVSHKWGVRGI
jgi:hypothetical protein